MGMRIANKLIGADVFKDSKPDTALNDAGIADTDTKTILWGGNVIGWASGLTYRSNNFGDGPAIGITGAFETLPMDPETGKLRADVDVVRSNVLFMPKGIQDLMVANMLEGGEHAVTQAPKKGQRIDVPAKQLKILLQVGVRRNTATGGAGYEFVINYAGEAQKIDMLEALKEELRTGKAQTLPPPQKQAALAAPGAGKGGKGGKVAGKKK